MGATNKEPREESNALVPGVTVWMKETGSPETGSYQSMTVSGSAQTPDGRKRINRSVKAHGLRVALKEVCQWRFEEANPPGYESAEALFEEAWSRIRERYEGV